jgi:hypothetical protein
MKEAGLERIFINGLLVFILAAIPACDKESSPKNVVLDETKQESKKMNDYAKTVRDNIENHGFHVTYVAAGQEPSFAYSTGIYEAHSIPELLISSLPPGLSHEIVSQYLNRFKESSPIIGKRIPAKDERFDYYLIPVANDRIADRVLATRKYYGQRPYKYLQLVFPDTSMKFPHEKGYLYDQEIFGTFPPESGKSDVGNEQPSARSNLDSKGGDKPQPESEGHSQ